MPGKVYLVGAGPGDPGLLTLKGKAALERADCVVYDFLAAASLLRFAKPEAEKIFVGKRGGGPRRPLRARPMPGAITNCGPMTPA